MQVMLAVWKFNMKANAEQQQQHLDVKIYRHENTTIEEDKGTQPSRGSRDKRQRSR